MNWRRERDAFMEDLTLGDLPTAAREIGRRQHECKSESPQFLATNGKKRSRARGCRRSPGPLLSQPFRI